MFLSIILSSNYPKNIFWYSHDTLGSSPFTVILHKHIYRAESTHLGATELLEPFPPYMKVWSPNIVFCSPWGWKKNEGRGVFADKLQVPVRILIRESSVVARLLLSLAVQFLQKFSRFWSIALKLIHCICGQETQPTFF